MEWVPLSWPWILPQFNINLFDNFSTLAPQERGTGFFPRLDLWWLFSPFLIEHFQRYLPQVLRHRRRHLLRGRNPTINQEVELRELSISLLNYALFTTITTTINIIASIKNACNSWISTRKSWVPHFISFNHNKQLNIHHCPFLLKSVKQQIRASIIPSASNIHYLSFEKKQSLILQLESLSEAF